VLKVTADTKILISALACAHGKPLQFLQMATAGDINLKVSENIVGEMVDVLVQIERHAPRSLRSPTDCRVRSFRWFGLYRDRGQRPAASEPI
jgi:hypothetical protein